MERDRFAEAFGHIAWYDGYNGWLWQISDRLKELKDGEFLPCPLSTDHWMTDRHALWIMLVSAFGNWGTSIRSGWIEQTKEAADFIDAATERFEEDTWA